MPKIQGKQIADNTIVQGNLNLVTPSSGETQHAATVEYVNTFVTSRSGDTVIGNPEDTTYSDGLFTDFTPETKIGVAIDRFNEVLLLLAPTPPSENWTNVFSNLVIPSTYSARALTTGVSTSNITSDTTPSFSITDTVSTGTSSKARPSGSNTITFTLTDTSVQLEQVIISSSDTGKTSGIIQYSVSDPYVGVSGKEGFWSGITSFSVSGTLSSILPSASQRSIVFTHIGTDSPETFNYYIDNPTTPSITSIVATPPTMTRYISGVPSLASGDVVSAVGFTVLSGVSYFYNQSLYDFTGTQITNSLANSPTAIPTTAWQSIVENGKTVTVANNQYSNTSFSFNIVARSANGTSATSLYTSTAHRLDTVSNESSRKTSGSGSYPATGWGGVFDSTQSLVSTYTEELQLRNGIYLYPTGDYSAVGGPNYSAASGTRWVTFNIGSFSNNQAFTLNIVGSAGISSKYNTAGLLIEVKISGATSWVDANAAYSGVGNPGSGADGVAAVVDASSTNTSRRITFGTLSYTGAIIVRVGLINGSTGITFSSLTATSII